MRAADLGTALARFLLMVAGGLALCWVWAVLQIFRSEAGIVDVAKAVIAGEIFKPGLLDTMASRAEGSDGSTLRSSVLGKAAVIRLRLAEDALRSNDKESSATRLNSLTQIIDVALANAPSDPFLWLARFWLNDNRHGFSLDHLPDLQMSYDLGRYEGWVSVKRNPVALEIFPKLPSDMTELTVAEFVGLVRWDLAADAADIAMGPGRGLRGLLFPRLKGLSVDQRRRFAQLIYQQELDDVPVPGVDPPRQQIPMPVLPPGY